MTLLVIVLIVVAEASTPYISRRCASISRVVMPLAYIAIRASGYGPDSQKLIIPNTPCLYNLEHDPSEKYDVGKKHPEVIADLRKEIEDHKANLVALDSQLDV